MDLTRLIDDRGISRSELARRLGHKSPGLVSNVCQGKASIPLDKLDEWADALGLEGEARTEFKSLAIAEQAPQVAADLRAAQERALEATTTLRLSMAHVHAGRQAPTPREIAEDTGLDLVDVMRAYHTGKGSEEALQAVCLALGITPEWVFLGKDDPDWYRAQILLAQPDDGTWAAEVARLRRNAPRSGASGGAPRSPGSGRP